MITAFSFLTRSPLSTTTFRVAFICSRSLLSQNYYLRASVLSDLFLWKQSESQFTRIKLFCFFVFPIKDRTNYFGKLGYLCCVTTINNHLFAVQHKPKLTLPGCQRLLLVSGIHSCNHIYIEISELFSLLMLYM